MWGRGVKGLSKKKNKEKAHEHSVVTTGGRRVSGVEEGICKINGNGGNGEKEKRKKLNILLENLNKTFF